MTRYWAAASSAGHLRPAVRGDWLSEMWFLVLLALVVASSAAAQTDDDTAVRPNAKPRFQVVDGNTVEFGPQLVRLFGMDAPE